MTYETLIEERRGNVAVLTLNRPHRLNALDRQLFEELDDALMRIERDDDVHAWILTGVPRPDGRPMFSAGLDVKAWRDDPFSPELARGVMNRIDDMLKPSIAAIGGICTTGAMELALACDIRVAAESAQLSDWHMKTFGLGIGMWGGGTRLTRLVGASKAKQLILSGRAINAREAWRIGLVNEVFPDEVAFDEALSLATDIAVSALDGIRATLGFLETNVDMHKHQSLRWIDIIQDLMRARPVQAP